MIAVDGACGVEKRSGKRINMSFVDHLIEASAATIRALGA